MVFNVWITLLTPLSINSLLGGLVRKGYTVGPLNPEESLYEEGQVSTLLGLEVRLVDGNEEVTDEALDDLLVYLVDLFKETNTKYHSFVITEESAARWDSGNIVLPIPQYKPKTVFEHLENDD